MPVSADVIPPSRQASLDGVRALVRAVEAKDPYTRQHSEQVAHYTVHLSRAMGTGGEQIESFRVAALLHDVGKIGVPDAVLTKTGPLAPEEFEYIRRHPAVGADILSHFAVFAAEAHLVRHHHERWDGKGYPDGLTGEESPTGARIIHVADCIDAMLMDRSYKSAYPVEKMLDELARCAGSQFDPAVAARACRWCRDNPRLLILPGVTLEDLAA
jgi:putative nucleotidyltransferase with HDIG domain